jgi:hypothetical protein
MKLSKIRTWQKTTNLRQAKDVSRFIFQTFVERGTNAWHSHPLKVSFPFSCIFYRLKIPMGKKNLFFSFSRKTKKNIWTISNGPALKVCLVSRFLYIQEVFSSFYATKSLPHTYLPTLHLNLAHSRMCYSFVLLGHLLLLLFVVNSDKDLNKKHIFQLT